MRSTRALLPVLIAGLVLSSTASAAWGALSTSAGADPSSLASGSSPAANPDTVLTFLAALPHRAAALEQAAVAISTPGSPSFRQYLSVQEAAARFGATSGQIAAVRKAARSLGLKAEIDPTGLITRISGPVSAWEKAMGAPVQFTPATPGNPYDTYVFPAAKTPSTQGDFWRDQYEAQFGVTRDAPPAIAATVTTFAASYSEYVPGMETSPGTRVVAARSGESKGTRVQSGAKPRAIYGPGDFTQVPPTNPAAALMKSCINEPGAPLGGLQPDDFVSYGQVFRTYGLLGLQRSEGANASGRVTVISIRGGYSEADLAQAAACFGFTKPEVRITLGTGLGSPLGNVDGETALDVQTVSATLKNARAIQLVQVAQRESGIAYVDGFSRALTATPRPYAITLSYGFCEPLVAPFGMFPTVGTLFRFAAVVGTTITAGSGDGGSSACQVDAGKSLGFEFEVLDLLQERVPVAAGQELVRLQTEIASEERTIEQLLAVASYPRPTVYFPASSPWATAVGGTRMQLTPDGARAAEVVWNDQPYSGGVVQNIVGTGGASAAFNMPAYQRPLTWSNTRSVPDISAMASPYPSLPTLVGGTISQSGGTSQSSPMMAAALALLSSQEVRQGRPRLGFVNPWLYDVVRRHPQTVYDVTIGDNQFAIPLNPEQTTLNIPACCQAGLGYDQATGLGVLDFSELRNHTTVR